MSSVMHLLEKAGHCYELARNSSSPTVATTLNEIGRVYWRQAQALRFSSCGTSKETEGLCDWSVARR
jgi:hypothetical protein